MARNRPREAKVGGGGRAARGPARKLLQVPRTGEVAGKEDVDRSHGSFKRPSFCGYILKVEAIGLPDPLDVEGGRKRRVV